MSKALFLGIMVVLVGCTPQPKTTVTKPEHDLLSELGDEFVAAPPAYSTSNGEYVTIYEELAWKRCQRDQRKKFKAKLAEEQTQQKGIILWTEEEQKALKLFQEEAILMEKENGSKGIFNNNK